MSNPHALVHTPADQIAAELEAAHRAQEDAQEVVVGAIRGLLECSAWGDKEAEQILRAIRNAHYQGVSDDALRDALDLFTEKLSYWRSVAAKARAVISRQEG